MVIGLMPACVKIDRVSPMLKADWAHQQRTKKPQCFEKQCGKSYSSLTRSDGSRWEKNGDRTC